MTTPQQAETNRRNAQKSTGPKTPEGKNRSRFNAVKHGLSAKTLVLPGEDEEAFQARRDAWTVDLQPQNDVEQYLVDQAARVSWQLDRADRAEAARLARNIRVVPAEEALRQEDEALALGRRLFWDRRGPLALYPHGELRNELVADRKPRTSFAPLADDPDDPARLVLQLESTAAGCRWLLDCWGELRAILDAGLPWQPPDKLMAIRLLGKQPLDAAGDDEVAALFLAAEVLQPGEKVFFREIFHELLAGEITIYKQRLTDSLVENLMPADEAGAKEVLLGIVGTAVTRLDALAQRHQERAAADAASAGARLSFDGSQEGERLRRYQISCGRSLLRTLDTLLKIRKAGVGQPLDSDPAKPADTGPSETVADSYARNFFESSGDLVPAESALGTGFPTPPSPDVPAGIEAAPRIDPIGPPIDAPLRLSPQNEPTAAADDDPRLQNEPTAAAGDDPRLQNEPSAAAGDDSRLQNEPTAAPIDHRNLQTEPTSVTRAPAPANSSAACSGSFATLRCWGRE